MNIGSWKVFVLVDDGDAALGREDAVAGVDRHDVLVADVERREVDLAALGGVASLGRPFLRNASAPAFVGVAVVAVSAMAVLLTSVRVT
jgi:hypothetical protein